MTPEEALTHGFQRWLDAAIVREQHARVSLEVLDPYATSMRSAEHVRNALVQVADGSLATAGGDTTQKLADLRSMGLAEGTVTASALSPFGAAVMTAWGRLGILDHVAGDAKRFEFPRNVALVITALDLSYGDYVTWFRRWQALRSDRPADEWFDDVWGLTAAAYLRYERAGYTPYDVMVAAGCPHWKHRADLEAWASRMSKPKGWSKSRLAVLLDDRVEGTATRARAKVLFCRAMEAVTLQREGMSAAGLRETFIRWGVEDD